MPFTNNRSYKANPKLFAKAKGIYYYTADGREILDGMSGIWCCNAGHGQPKIIEAIKKQVLLILLIKINPYRLDFFIFIFRGLGG